MRNPMYLLKSQEAHSSQHKMVMQESEGEDAAEGRVTLPQDMGRGNLASRQSRIRLQEVQSSHVPHRHMWNACSRAEHNA